MNRGIILAFALVYLNESSALVLVRSVFLVESSQVQFVVFVLSVELFRVYLPNWEPVAFVVFS